MGSKVSESKECRQLFTPLHKKWLSMKGLKCISSICTPHVGKCTGLNSAETSVDRTMGPTLNELGSHFNSRTLLHALSLDICVLDIC